MLLASLGNQCGLKHFGRGGGFRGHVKSSLDTLASIGIDVGIAMLDKQFHLEWIKLISSVQNRHSGVRRYPLPPLGEGRLGATGNKTRKFRLDTGVRRYDVRMHGINGTGY